MVAGPLLAYEALVLPAAHAASVAHLHRAAQELLKLKEQRSGKAAANGPSPAASTEDEGEEWSQVGRKGAAVTSRGDESLVVRPGSRCPLPSYPDNRRL